MVGAIVLNVSDVICRLMDLRIEIGHPTDPTHLVPVITNDGDGALGVRHNGRHENGLNNRARE